MINRSIIVSSINAQPDRDFPQAINTKSGLSEAHRRLPLNLFSNFIWLVINTIIGLWYTPFLIANLGVAVYGIVPLIQSVTNYLHLLTDGFNSAVSRFLQIELARHDVNMANRTFNTSIVGAVAIIVLVLPIAVILALLAPRIFDVPSGFVWDTQWLILLTMLTFAITFLSSSFAISSFSSHRFDLRLGLNIVRLSVQIGSVVLLFTVMPPQLWQIGVGTFLSSILYLLGHRVLCRRLTPFLKIQPSLFDTSRLKQMLQFSGWVLVNQAGAYLFLNIDLIIANLVFGALTAGRYGAVLLFSSMLRAMVGTISAVLDPIVFTLYAQNNLSRLAHFCGLSVKLMGLIIALPIGLICGFAKPLLTVWLGPEYTDLSWLVVVLVSHLCINLAVVPLFSIQVSTNHVRLPGILTLVMGITNACLAFALAQWSGWGYISIAIAGAVVLTAKNALFTPLYNARILRLPWWTFMTRMAVSTLACLLISMAAYWISFNWSLTGWPQLALAATIVMIMYAFAAYFLGLSNSERFFIKFEIRQRLIK